jgi:hypothetical protein
MTHTAEGASLSMPEDPWEARSDDGHPDAIEGETTRALAAPAEDGAAPARSIAEDPDAT